MGMKLEETLVEEKIYGEKRVRRLKADLSRKLFQTLFEAEGFVWSMVEAEVREAVDKPFRLDPYEALFMAVSRVEETEPMAVFFSERWDTPVRKTGDLYRHMIQFRSVFFDEEVLEVLLSGESPVSEIINRANDQQAALRQCFALCYSGMLAFTEEAGDGMHGASDMRSERGAESSAGAATTLMIVPSEVEALKEMNRQTQFIATRPDLDREARKAEAVAEAEVEAEAEAEAETEAEAAEPEVVGEVSEQELPDERERADTRRTSVSNEQIFVRPIKPISPSRSVSTRTPPTQPAQRQRERRGPETVDDVLKMALQEAQQAMADLGPEEAEKLTRRGDRLRGAGAIDFKDLMTRLKTGDTDRNREIPTEPVTERVPVEPPPLPPAAVLQKPPGAEVSSTFDVGQTLAPLPPRSLPQPDTDEHIEELLADEYSKMRTRGFYEILEVTPTCQLSDIRAAHARLKHRFSDENYEGYVLSDRSREILRLLNTTLDHARKALSGRAERRLYDTRNRTEYPDDPELFYSKLFNAFDFFLQARHRVKMTHWVEAYNLLGQASDLNPEEPEYHAYRAWSLYQGYKTGQVRDDQAPDKARQLLEQSLKLRELCEPGLLYRARLERDQGNTDDAAACYARLLRVNPHHSTAREELKQVTRADGDAAGSPKRKGIWARIKARFRGWS